MKLFTLNLASAPAAIAMMVMMCCLLTSKVSAQDAEVETDETMTAPSSSDVAYLTYSSDDQCRAVAVAKPVLNNVHFRIPLLPDATQPCSELVACAIDAASRQCAAVGGSADMEHATLAIQIRDQGREVWECDTSNDAANEESCAYKSPRDCFPSSILPGCYVRYITAERFSQLAFESITSCEEAAANTSGGSRLWITTSGALVGLVSVVLAGGGGALLALL